MTNQHQNYMTKHAADLAAGGYSFLPVVPGDKAPGECIGGYWRKMTNWQRYCANPPTADEIAIWKSWRECSVGITGRGLAPIDVDTLHPELSDRVEAYLRQKLGAAVIKRVGQAPKFLILCRAAADARYRKSREYRMPGDAPDAKAHSIEILCGNSRNVQFVAYGIHPATGAPYEWHGGEPTFAETWLLPEFTNEDITALFAEFDRIAGALGGVLKSRGALEDDEPGQSDRPRNLTATRAEIESALRYTPNEDVHYDDWFRMACAIKTALGEDGFDVFEDWSKASAKYVPEATRRAWESINQDPDRKRVAGADSIFKLARKNGWKGYSAVQRGKLYAIPPGEVRPFLDDIWLVRKLLTAGGMSVIYGDSNAGKTAFTMALGYHVASGRRFANLRTEKGCVVYVAAEAGRSSQNRLVALYEHHGDDRAQVPFYLVPCPVNLLDPLADLDRLGEVIEEVSKDWGGAALVVIDTLSRAIAGGNENSPDDMGAFVANIDALRSRTKAHVAIVHHCGKDAAKGARGHSLLRAATDTEIEISKPEDSDTGTAKVTKLRDAEFVKPMGYQLEGKRIGYDDLGDEVSAVYAVMLDAAPEVDFANKKVPLVGDEANLIALIRKARGTLGVDKARNMFVGARAKRVPGKTDDAHKKAFQRAKKDLISGGHVEESGGALVANPRTNPRTNEAP